jgi:acyl-CoA dehydrogenase
MNPERILIASEAVGLGKLALSRAAEYAKTRIVFNRPIGKTRRSSIRWRRTGSSSRRPG